MLLVTTSYFIHSKLSAFLIPIRSVHLGKYFCVIMSSYNETAIREYSNLWKYSTIWAFSFCIINFKWFSIFISVSFVSLSSYIITASTILVAHPNDHITVIKESSNAWVHLIIFCYRIYLKFRADFLKSKFIWWCQISFLVLLFDLSSSMSMLSLCFHFTFSSDNSSREAPQHWHIRE